MTMGPSGPSQAGDPSASFSTVQNQPITELLPNCVYIKCDFRIHRSRRQIIPRMSPRSRSSGSSISASHNRKEQHESSHAEVPATPKLTSPEVVERNWWWKYKQFLREYVAEFTGVVLLIIFGAGANCQVVLSSNPGVSSAPKGEYLSISFGWGIGTAMGVWACAGISGGHINPAVTLALATWRGFPWKKVPGYLFAQLMGGLVGAALVYANYFHAIDIFEGGRGVRTLKTAGLFSTYALDYMTNVSAFFSEFLATAVLMLVILATTDRFNLPVPNGLLPVMLFLLILGLGAAMGMETAYALNPARDLGPRLLTSMVGYGKAVYTYRHQYWIWCPILAPTLGAQFGAMFYEIFLFNGEEGVCNRPGRATKKSMESQAEGV
ncbi:hypothetical protein D9615_003364 [Tricholomella constricta]|uniref:Aquaporin n=1 Tax=Tricholomella constricta TaxID=117010 RepID=A0A8H5HIW4_9AGAR|nr:hypothetical protein D9615_003364 [Tricholomella constricta]